MKVVEAVLIWGFFLLTSVLGHVALKKAAGQADRFDYVRALTLWKDPWGLAAVLSWGLSCVLWGLLLTRYDVSTAAGTSALRYVLMLVAAAIWFSEPMSMRQGAGCVLITLGIILVAK